jgi:DNA-binding response OmpR family regulator
MRRNELADESENGLGLLGRTRTLDSHASRLRRKIAAVTDTPYVLNEWGVGYRLMLPA